jgi:chitinase
MLTIFSWIIALLLCPAYSYSSLPPFQLHGYLCADCPSAPQPNALVQSIHASYTRVIFSFGGWDASGHLLNQWDSVDKNFTLTPAIVAALKQQGRQVFLSLGGGAANILSPDIAFGTLAGELGALVARLGLDGVDLDFENFSGDIAACMAGVAAFLAALRAQHPSLLFSCAPQMTDLYPDYLQVTAGFNRYAPLLGSSSALFDAVMPQMYNSWAQVETIPYARYYAAALLGGFSVQGAGGTKYNVTVPSAALLLGYPASRSAAGSGFLSPTSIVAMGRALAANSTPIRGFMTWSIGWDQQASWQFAEAVRTG